MASLAAAKKKDLDVEPETRVVRLWCERLQWIVSKSSGQFSAAIFAFISPPSAAVTDVTT